MATTPGPKPPNQAATAMNGKKKMNGNAVGPTPGEIACRSSRPARAHRIATPYRSQAGRVEGREYGQESIVTGPKVPPPRSRELPNGQAPPSEPFLELTPGP